MQTETQLPTLVDLTPEQIVDTARAANEPGWMIVQRSAAWAQFVETIPPIWKRTDLRQLTPDAIAAPLGARGTALEWDATLAEQGVVFMPLRDALREHEGIVKQYMNTVIEPTRHKFAALHAALWQDGVFVYVPKNVAVEVPLRAIFTIPPGSTSVFPHNLVVLEQGASAIFVEEFTSGDGAGQVFASPKTEIVLGAGSSLRFITAQTWGANVYHIGAQIAQVGDDASLEWSAISLGGKTQHVEAETYLSGTGARVNWMASTFAQQGQALLTAPWLRHIGTNTDGHMDFKTVVSSGGYTTFDGMIKIEKGSKGTISRLEDHAIHLGDKARSDSIPGLMIDTNDVQRAGHASTSGEVDEEMLFYMRSRGIKREDAIKLVVMGFFEPVLARVPSEELRDRITALIEAKI